MTNFQFLVKESNKSLTEISHETGISYSTLGNYNQGTRTPKKENAKILADYFGVSIPYLLGLDDNPNLVDPFKKPPTRIRKLISESGNRLKELRKEKKMTQEQLANAIQVTKLTVSNWENNKHPIKSDKVSVLADLFGVSIPYLLGDEKDFNLIKAEPIIPKKLVQELASINDTKAELLQEYLELAKREQAILNRLRRVSRVSDATNPFRD